MEEINCVLENKDSTEPDKSTVNEPIPAQTKLDSRSTQNTRGLPHQCFSDPEWSHQYTSTEEVETEQNICTRYDDIEHARYICTACRHRVLIQFPCTEPEKSHHIQYTCGVKEKTKYNCFKGSEIEQYTYNITDRDTTQYTTNLCLTKEPAQVEQYRSIASTNVGLTRCTACAHDEMALYISTTTRENQTCEQCKYGTLHQQCVKCACVRCDLSQHTCTADCSVEPVREPVSESEMKVPERSCETTSVGDTASIHSRYIPYVYRNGYTYIYSGNRVAVIGKLNKILAL